MKSVISADSRHHNPFCRYALRSMPPPVGDLDRIGIGIARTRAMLADPIDDAPYRLSRGSMSASVTAATSGPAANRNREAWPASPGPGAPSWSCCPAHWEAPAGATAGSRRECPSLFRALHATNASRQVSGASSPMSAASTATLRTARDPRYGHRAEPRGLQSAQPRV